MVIFDLVWEQISKNELSFSNEYHIINVDVDVVFGFANPLKNLIEDLGQVKSSCKKANFRLLIYVKFLFMEL